MILKFIEIETDLFSDISKVMLFETMMYIMKIIVLFFLMIRVVATRRHREADTICNIIFVFKA